MSKELFIPMSSLQCAYMIERERGLKTTGTPCHVYMEFDTVDLDGVSVQRILKNHCQGNEKYPVPLVFSPSFEIPMLSEVFLNEIGDLSYIISQTPGVWLDAQVYQLKQDFFFSWVILEGILDETELSEMMDLYIKILTEIDKSEGGNLDEYKGTRRNN